jgi:hypothetical protein
MSKGPMSMSPHPAAGPCCSTEAVNQLCGFHFDRCKGPQGGTPPGLYTAAARLIQVSGPSYMGSFYPVGRPACSCLGL